MNWMRSNRHQQWTVSMRANKELLQFWTNSGWSTRTEAGIQNRLYPSSGRSKCTRMRTKCVPWFVRLVLREDGTLNILRTCKLHELPLNKILIKPVWEPFTNTLVWEPPTGLYILQPSTYPSKRVYNVVISRHLYLTNSYTVMWALYDS